MNRLLNTCAVLVTASTLTFAPFAANISAAGAEELNPATASCTVPNHQAKTIIAVPAETPPIAAQDYLTGTADVQVDIDANGSTIGAYIMKSSGVPILDRAALKAARESSFQPEVRDCAAVAGSYIFQVDFTE